MDNRERMAQRQQERSASGRCTRCGGERPDARYKECDACRAAGAERRARLRQERRCSTCGKEPAEPHRRRCAACNERDALRRAAHVGRCKEERRCPDCGGPNPDATYRCGACRHRWSTAKRGYLKNYKRAVLAHYGEACVCCGEREIGFLTMDHIGNDGGSHRRALAATGETGPIWPWLINHDFPPGFQTMCFNCNCGRAANGGVCPHVTRKDAR